MGFANGAIFVICCFSLCWFRDVAPTEINPHRIAGAVVSFLGLVVACARLSQECSLALFAVLQFALWVILCLYFRKRLKVQPSEIATAS
jgi:hypothetical protein